jgi:CRISPR-associated protein Csa2
MFLSMSFRLRVEVEALNMVEAMGAYTRHRTVSILKSRGEGKGYRLVIAPAVSGQAVAYGYMKSLVELAQRKGLPVCDQCRSYEAKGGFIKHGTDTKGELEKLVKDCIVEDVTGFMVAEAKIRRTSPIQFSYMALDIDKVGTIPGDDGKPRVIVNDRAERVKTAIQAIANLLEGLSFGAKKARYLPIYEVVGAVAAVSHPVPFTVSPARLSRDGNYIDKTVARATTYVKLFSDVNEYIKVLYMDREGVAGEVKAEGIEVEKVNSISDLIAKIIEVVEGKLGSQA